MPTQAITQALNALLPSIPATGKQFPTSLVSQSESLLALSRQRHPKLKVEEEIARAHVCTEIICERLRVQLRLPAVKSGAGAPCKPTVYKKLYKFLDAALADAALGSLTPKGTKRSAAGTPKTAGSSIQKAPLQTLESDTPTKKRTVDKVAGLDFVGTIKSNPRPGPSEGTSNDGKAPAFVMPLIRKISRHFNTAIMVPHVYTGSCIVLKLTDVWDPERYKQTTITAEQKKQITALVIALYLMVLTRMRKGKMTSAVYNMVSTKSLDLADDVTVDDLPDIEEWIAKLNAEGWCNGQDWWDSVPENVIVLGQPSTTDGVDVHGDDVDEDDGLEDTRMSEKTQWNTLRKEELTQDDPEGVLLPGLGTMLHGGNDWASEERQVEFQAWTNNLMRKMTAMDRADARKGKAVAVS